MAVSIRDLPDSDQISYIEGLRARQGQEKFATNTAPPAVALNIWLAKKKEPSRSWRSLGKEFFSHRHRPGGGKGYALDPAIAAAKRAFQRVEGFMNPTQKQLLRRKRAEAKVNAKLEELGIPSRVIRSAFGCSPKHLLAQLSRRLSHPRLRRFNPSQPPRTASPGKPEKD